MTESRRGFMSRFRWLPALPFAGMAIQRTEPALKFVRYSAKAKVDPWIGWLETQAGTVVGFIDKAGKRFMIH